MAKKKLTKDDIKHLAKLSALELSEEELELYTKQFDETLDYIENLKELDTSKVSEAEHMSGQKNVFFDDGTKCERMLSQKETTKNSKKHKDGYFVVERIL